MTDEDDTTEIRFEIDAQTYDDWKGTLSKNDRIPDHLERLMREDTGR